MVRLADVPEPERTHIANLECPDYPDTPRSVPPRKASERVVALVSSAGLMVRGERPCLPRDAGYRAIAADVADGDILCSHVSPNFDRTGFQQDLNVMLPRERLAELACEGVIGAAADTHYSFMGATGPDALEPKGRELARRLIADGVNCVVFAPV